MKSFEEWYENTGVEWHNPKKLARMAWNAGVQESSLVPIRAATDVDRLDATSLHQQIRELKDE